jgi:acyl-CoA reductase-like NAD-dependent aldehyde dehydrogenase
MESYGLWIDGAERQSAQRCTVRVPFDGRAVAEVALAGPAELEDAVSAAAAAAPVMRAMSREDRAAILRRAHFALLEQREEFARTIASESGKPLREARVEADRGASTLLFSSEEAHRLAGEVVPMDAARGGEGRWAMTLREPLGVIAAITPFNFPLNLSLHKIAPAIAAGNAVVHKPASSTPVSALLLARLLASCGLPSGALNVVPGPGAIAGDFLVAHPAVRMITFTGSAEVGLALRARAGMKRVTLELGNNSSLIIAADAKLDDAAARAVPGSFAHSGQVCISVQRIFVERKVASDFIERVAAGARALTIGDPLDENTAISSLIQESEAERVCEWIGEARTLGATLVCGGKRSAATVVPAVLAGVPPQARLSRMEAFGPVVGINPVDSIEEAITMVNSSDYGLQAAIFTNDLERAFTAARQIHVGGFLINDVPQFRLDHMPYGGVKLSGSGREGPRYAVEEMTELKLVSWRV